MQRTIIETIKIKFIPNTSERVEVLSPYIKKGFKVTTSWEENKDDFNSEIYHIITKDITKEIELLEAMANKI